MSIQSVGSDVQSVTISGGEVKAPQKPKRYSAAFKLRVIEEADKCVAPGEIGALLRREGIFASTLSDFRRQQARGILQAGSASLKKVSADSPLLKALAASEREVRRLKRELECANALLELQKKVSEVMGLTLLRHD